MLALAPTERPRPTQAKITNRSLGFEEVIHGSGVPCRGLTCELRNDKLLIHGCVDTFHDKQRVQEAVRGLVGAEQICNHLQVDSSA